MIRTETGDGASLAGRPELGTILEFIHPGETLVVTRIDRLARSMRDLQVIVATLKDKGAHLAATEQPVDTSTAAGKAFFDMLGVFAEFETNLRRERQAEGIAAAKQRGAYRGRPPGSTWKPSGIGWPWACRRRKSLASWGSRAEPSTRPGRAARDEGRQVRVRTRERCHPSRSVTPSARLFELRSARCSYMHVRAVWADKLRAPSCRWWHGLSVQDTGRACGTSFLSTGKKKQAISLSSFAPSFSYPN